MVRIIHTYSIIYFMISTSIHSTVVSLISDHKFCTLTHTIIIYNVHVYTHTPHMHAYATVSWTISSCRLLWRETATLAISCYMIYPCIILSASQRLQRWLEKKINRKAGYGLDLSNAQYYQSPHPRDSASATLYHAVTGRERGVASWPSAIYIIIMKN